MQFHGPSTALNARKRPIGTNSKPRAATAWNCWPTRPKHKFGQPSRAREQSCARGVFGPSQDGHHPGQTAPNPAISSPPMWVGKWGFSRFLGIALIWYYLDKDAIPTA